MKDIREAIGIRDLAFELVTVKDLVDRQVLDRPIDGNHGEIHPKSEDFVSEGVPFVMASDLRNGRVDYANCAKITERQAEGLRKGFARNGDVLLTHKATIGATAIVDYDKHPYIMLTPQVTYYRVRDPKALNNRYLKHYFDSSLFQQTLHMLASSGSTRAYLGITEQQRLPVVLPPFEKQQKIAGILSAYDDLIANNQRRIALLEGMAEEIYREWFVRRRAPSDLKGGEGSWQEKRFDEFCVFRKGRTPAEVHQVPDGELAPYLSVDALDGNAPTEWVVPRRNDVIAGPDGVVMLMDGARSGAVFRGASGVVGSTASLVETADANRAMVFEYLKAMREVIVWNNTGSAIPHANKDFIHRMLLPVPRDVRVLEAFNLLYEPFFNQQQALRGANHQLRRTRDALLPRLISGKLKVDHLDIRLPPSMRAEAEAVA